MSLIINDKKVAGLYKAYVIQNATNTASGIIRIATEEEVKAGLDSLTAVTPKQLATKQDVLIAGNGLEILEDGTINNTQTSAEWGNIIGNILDQEDLNAILLTKANEEETAYELIYENSILTLKNRKGDTLSEVSINELPDVDDVTIVINEENKLQSIGEKTKSGTFKYTWIGTEEEYTQAKDLGVIDEFTECIIVDSEAEKVVPIVQYEAPTKLSQLANDIEYVTNDELQSVKTSLENKIDLQTDGAEIVHRVGNETIDGFKNFKQKIVIENGLGKGRIAHKPVDTSLEDGYIEFGDNTLLYGKQNIQGELYDEKHDIFHAGNLVAGNNITITEKDGVYKINGQAGGGSSYELPVASTTTLGGVKVDGDTIKVTQEGIISANVSNYELPIASTDTLGGVKVDGKTIKVTEEGVISSNGGGLEIGDIGIAPLGIDETKGKRRYLNGQLIIQEQYVQFTNKVKSAVALYPSLACTESEWQITAIMTVGGQVGKFVIDDEAGTIRLPKIIMPIQGLTDLSKLGQIVEAGLPNITGSVIIGEGAYFTNSPNGCFASFSGSSLEDPGSGGSGTSTANFDASASNPIYGNSTTVQQEQIQYPYFIQVATGAETEDNIINEIELNNPFSLLDYKYSEYELNNLSWLRSNGQWNSKATYPAVYDLLLKEYNNPNRFATFNKDVFTVIGSPTITEDGEASGFTASNYLDTKFLINTDVVIKGSFTVSSKTSNNVGQLFSIGNASDNNGLRFVVSTSGFLQMAQLQTWINYVWEAKYVINVPIFYEVIISGTSVNLKLTQNNTEIANVSGTVPNDINGTISLGSELVNGSIDLKQFSITADGVKVFSGANSKIKNTTDADITDYDFRINTADETFRLPIKVKQKLYNNIAPVVGNGMTLGFTNGSQYGGKVGSGYVCYEGLYGTPVGTNNSGSGFANTSLGITTDPTKSGIEAHLAENTDLYLYFYVGETVQNANLINAGRIEEKLTDKLDRSDVKAYITETYVNGTSWYRIWSDKWCEQGSYMSGMANNETTYSFVKPFKTLISINIQRRSVDNTRGSSININTDFGKVWNVSNTGFNTWGNWGDNSNLYWQASGYIA